MALFLHNHIASGSRKSNWRMGVGSAVGVKAALGLRVKEVTFIEAEWAPTGAELYVTFFSPPVRYMASFMLKLSKLKLRDSWVPSPTKWETRSLLVMWSWSRWPSITSTAPCRFTGQCTHSLRPRKAKWMGIWGYLVKCYSTRRLSFYNSTPLLTSLKHSVL